MNPGLCDDYRSLTVSKPGRTEFLNGWSDAVPSSVLQPIDTSRLTIVNSSPRQVPPVSFPNQRFHPFTVSL